MQKIAIIAENLPEKMKSWSKALKNGKPIKINTLIKQKSVCLSRRFFHIHLRIIRQMELIERIEHKAHDHADDSGEGHTGERYIYQYMYSLIDAWYILHYTVTRFIIGINIHKG